MVEASAILHFFVNRLSHGDCDLGSRSTIFHIKVEFNGN